MHFKNLVQVTLLGGITVIRGIEVSNQDVSEGRQFSSSQSIDINKLNSVYNEQDKLQTFLSPQHFSAFPSEYAAEETNIIYDNTKAQKKSPEAIPESKITEKLSQTSPALSALVLLGFIYFLNFLQDVVSGSSGRRKRSVDNIYSPFEDMDEYLISMDEIVKKISDIVPWQNEVESRSLKDMIASLRKDGGSETPSEARAYRIVNFISSILGRIPQALGFTRRASSRKDDFDLGPDESSSSSGGFWNLFGSKVGLAATIMDFLSDPKPSRVGRSYPETAIDDVDNDTQGPYAEPSDLTDEEMKFLPISDNEVLSRNKRFTEGMNVWYSEAPGGHKNVDSPSSNAGGSQFLGLVLNILKGAMTS